MIYAKINKRIIYDFDQTIEFINNKYKIDLRDLYGRFDKAQRESFLKHWCNEKDIDYDWMKVYSSNSEIEERKFLLFKQFENWLEENFSYINFVDWVFDYYKPGNNSIFSIDLDQKESEDCPRKIRDVLDILLKEFKPPRNEIEFYINWNTEDKLHELVEMSENNNMRY